MMIMSFSLLACGGDEEEDTEDTTQEQETTGTDTTESETVEEDTQEDTDTETTETETTEAEDSLKIAMSTDIGGVNDESFNASAWRGLQRAQNELGVEVHYIESVSEADYDRNLKTLADENYDLIWGIGFLMEDAIKKAAKDRPDTKFGIIDSALGGNPPDNVVAVTFKEHEGSFLVGVIAGLMTKTDKIGFIGGIKFALIEKFMYGFKAGVKAVNPDAEILDTWAESFTDASKGKSLANQLYGSNCDIIYHAAGNVGKGLFESAKENDKWAIGVDSDQSRLAPDHILTSMMKRVDNAIFDVAAKLQGGVFQGGDIVEYGLAEGGVGIAPTSSRNVPEDILDNVDEWKKRIINDEFDVPSDKETWEEFISEGITLSGEAEKTTPETTDKNIKIAMSTDIGGVNDESFNASAWRGLQRAQNELGVEVHYIESVSEADYDRNLKTLADENYDLIWGIGFLMEDAIKKAAKDRPDTKFGIIDSALGGNPPDNVVAVTFKEHEGSFLVGVVAGLMTKTNKIGFIGGIKFALIEKFMYGFKAGVKSVNPDAEIIETWAESFTDASKGKSLANQLYGSNCDIIYHAAGNVGKGLFESAKENDKWAIGVDSDQSRLAPDHILTSMMKRVDNAIFDIASKLQKGIFQGGEIIEYGLAEGGVGIAPTSSRNIPEDILTLVEEWKNRIIDGVLEVPYDADTYEEFEENL